MLNSLRSDRRIPKSPAHPALLGKPERDLRVKTNTAKAWIVTLTSDEINFLI
jgi:hypothetical protein